MAPLAVTACAAAQSSDAQPLKFHGIFEEYFETDPSHKGVVGEQTYLQLSADISKKWKLVGTYIQEPGDKWLDDAYAQYDNGPDLIRIGRFRSPFGFSDWSELYYTPMIMVPMIRSYDLDVVPGISLYRLDRGAEYERSMGNVQIQFSTVDSQDDDWHVLPWQVDTGVARVQFSGSPLIVGLNGLAKASDNVGPAEQIVGLDLEWTAPRTKIRGEAITGIGSQAAKGYYVDVFYRPPGLARTQVGARIQGVSSSGDNDYTTGSYSYTYGTGSGYWPEPPAASTNQKTQVYTFAARQFLTQYLTLSVNYGAGNNTALSRGLLGWSSQLQFNYRF